MFGCLVRAVHAGDFVDASFDQAVFRSYVREANQEARRQGLDPTVDEYAD